MPCGIIIWGCTCQDYDGDDKEPSERPSYCLASAKHGRRTHGLEGFLTCELVKDRQYRIPKCIDQEGVQAKANIDKEHLPSLHAEILKQSVSIKPPDVFDLRRRALWEGTGFAMTTMSVISVLPNREAVAIRQT